MTVDRLSGCREKLRRAEEHITELREQIAAFEPTVVQGIDFITGDDVFRSANVTVPLRFSLICGEAIQQMRSLYDHAVCALVAAYGNQIRKDHGFPVFGSTTAYQSTTTRKIAGIPSGSLADKLIRTLQPFDQQSQTVVERHELHVLHVLDNAYKHQGVQLVAMRMQTRSIALNIPLRGPFGNHLLARFEVPMGSKRVEEGDEASRVVRGVGALGQSLEPRFDARFSVVFEQPDLVGGEEVILVLDRLFAFTHRALSSFELVLPQP